MWLMSHQMANRVPSYKSLKGNIRVSDVCHQRAAQQIVGRERRERLSQLALCGEGSFDSRRRVNSDVGRLTLGAINREADWQTSLHDVLFVHVCQCSNSARWQS